MRIWHINMFYLKWPSFLVIFYMSLYNRMKVNIIQYMKYIIYKQITLKVAKTNEITKWPKPSENKMVNDNTELYCSTDIELLSYLHSIVLVMWLRCHHCNITKLKSIKVWWAKLLKPSWCHNGECCSQKLLLSQNEHTIS